MQIIFKRLKIDAKLICFAAAILQVYGTKSYCDLSVAMNILPLLIWKYFNIQRAEGA